MDNEKFLYAVLQTAGGVLLMAACTGLGFAFKEIFRLRSDHSALSAKVEAQNDEVQRRFDRLDNAMQAIGDKMDKLLSRR